MSDLQRVTLTINGQTLSHTVTGESGAPPVVMLHGWGASLDLVWPLAQHLIPMGYRVYLPDLPGFGESAPPPVAWTVHDYARCVLAYADYHHLDSFHLFGHSFGGRIGLVLGAECPQRVRTLVLVDSAGVRPKTPFLSRARLGVYKTVRDGLTQVGLGRFSDRLRGWYNRRYGSADFQAVSGVMRKTFIHVVNEDLRPFAARVQPPTLLIWGDQDTDTPLWQARLLESLIPDAGLVVFPGAGHYSYLEHPIETARAMAALFGEV